MLSQIPETDQTTAILHVREGETVRRVEGAAPVAIVKLDPRIRRVLRRNRAEKLVPMFQVGPLFFATYAKALRYASGLPK